MKKVCLFNFPPIEDFHGYQLESFDPLAYFPKGARWSFYDLLSWGLNGWDHKRALATSAAGIDRLYRERDPNYMRLISDFVDRFRDFDLIVMSTYNFIHPEIFARELKKPIKILGFIDDPISTYLRGIPYLWAFDGAFFISPGYIDNMLFKDAINRWTNTPITWWPLVPYPFSKPHNVNDEFFNRRTIDVVYVGTPNGNKVDRLIKLKRHFGSRLRVHGRWRFKGAAGYIRGLYGKSVYPHLVTSLTTDQRTDLYWNAKIGLNMHVSDTPFETGNMRMYETPAHGAMMICDVAAADAHSTIFEPDKEAVYYRTTEQAIELIEGYLNDDESRIRIAKAGYERYWQDYSWEKNLLSFLNWGMSINKRGSSSESGQRR